ncbi:MAG: 1-acyl-sn-glycerol-3-phosphate acyltransferase [Treponema sp.]|nr:1-acyl-sn-glycerol-3-phosphate acyltransferase [Treponema sp.]
MGNSLREKYGSFFKELMSVSQAAAKIDESKVYEEANPKSRAYMDTMLNQIMKPDSGLKGIENFKAFYDSVVNEGKTGLILMEHYANTDLPTIIALLNKHGEEWSKDFANRIVAVAGMKLNEENPAVRAFAEGFTRVVIYPTRSLDAVNAKEISEEEKQEEEKRARKINFAAMRAMDECKKRGQIILVFPSGTRFRPDRPETKRGLREIDSYLRLFDNMLLVSINGNCLRIDPANPNDMLADIVVEDTLILTASPVIPCKKFRQGILDALPADEPDPKQKTVDRVMEILEEMHDAEEKNRA